MKIALIVAMDNKRGIGKNNDLMWHLPDDMAFFKDTTKGQIVVMGRKNYDSIPERFRPLPGRMNVVLTRNTDFQAPNCAVFNSLDDCLQYFSNDEERTLFIIGGGEIYRLALEANVVETMYITHIEKEYGADTFFPAFDKEEWNEEILGSHDIDERHDAAFTFVKYTRK